MFPLLDRLNEQQRRASTSAAPRLRILAGAGTGKTTTRTARATRHPSCASKARTAPRWR
jgi:ATP-dependent exoDNAse (exonuclease V) beta subunit